MNPPLQFEVPSDEGNRVARRFTTAVKNRDAPVQAMKELGYDFFGFDGDDSAEFPIPATFVISHGGLEPVRFEHVLYTRRNWLHGLSSGMQMG